MGTRQDERKWRAEKERAYRKPETGWILIYRITGPGADMLWSRLHDIGSLRVFRTRKAARKYAKEKAVNYTPQRVSVRFT